MIGLGSASGGPSVAQIWIASAPVDMRKSFDGLSQSPNGKEKKAHRAAPQGGAVGHKRHLRRRHRFRQ